MSTIAIKISVIWIIGYVQKTEKEATNKAALRGYIYSLNAFIQSNRELRKQD